MKLGVPIFTTDDSIRIDGLAREVGARGFESLFLDQYVTLVRRYS